MTAAYPAGRPCRTPLKNCLAIYYKFVILCVKWMNRGRHYRGIEVERPQLGGAGCGHHLPSANSVCVLAPLFQQRRTEFEDAPRKENQKFVLTHHYKIVMLNRQTRAAEHFPLFSDRSYRVDHRAVRMERGLGLALVRSILEPHGRSVTIQGKAGRGTTSQTEIPISIGTHCFCAALVA